MDTTVNFKVLALEKSIRIGYEFLNWARKFKGLTVAKGFDSALEAGSATKLPAAYTDADEMPESTAGEKKNNKDIIIIRIIIIATIKGSAPVLNSLMEYLLLLIA